MRIVLSLALLLLAACSDPAPKPTQETDTELRDSIQAPIDRAKAVEQSTLDDAEKQRQDIEDAGG